MSKRIFLAVSFGLFFLLVSLFFVVQKTPIIDSQNEKNFLPLQHKINKPSFLAYKNCTWVWRTNKDVGIWVQECDIKGKKLSIISQEKTSGFYYAVDFGTGYVVQELAFQVFNFENEYSPEQILDILYGKLLKSRLLKIESLCDFEEDKTVEVSLGPVYRLVPKDTHTPEKTPCGEYGDSQGKNKYFIITKAEKSKAVFINQVQKNIFDIQSLQILQ